MFVPIDKRFLFVRTNVLEKFSRAICGEGPTDPLARDAFDFLFWFEKFLSVMQIATNNYSFSNYHVQLVPRKKTGFTTNIVDRLGDLFKRKINVGFQILSNGNIHRF